jgi:hypothetical protein
MTTAVQALTLAMMAVAVTVHTQSNQAAIPAFEHYEAVRVALSADKLADVASHAKQLAAMVEPLGGSEAQKSADALAEATSIEDARKHFGDLSTILVPVFQQEKIPGTTAYMCAMKEKPWIQRGDKVENPYYGKAMLTCGSPLPAKK